MGKVKQWSVEKKDQIEKMLITMWAALGMDIPSNFEDIVQYCYEDICETADLENWSDGDVVIAFRRWIEDQHKVIKDITPSPFSNIDWSLLRDQKEHLISLNIGDPKLELDGIINLLDSFQDHAVDVLGIDEKLVFNSENDELLGRVQIDERSDKLDTETDEEYFARTNAEIIYQMRIEGTFLYENEDIPEEYIKSIVDDPEHAKKIKAIISANILKDVTNHPDNFSKDARGHFTYDATMYDYGFAIDDYCEKQFKAGKTKMVWVCKNCGSDKVQTKYWVDLNTKIIEGNVSDGENDDNYCPDCDGHHGVEQKEIPLV